MDSWQTFGNNLPEKNTEIHSIQDAKDLQDDLNAAARREQDWLMCFHPDKCNILSISSKQKPVTYKLHGHILKTTDSTKYLGVTLNQISNGTNTLTISHPKQIRP